MVWDAIIEIIASDIIPYSLQKCKANPIITEGKTRKKPGYNGAGKKS